MSHPKSNELIVVLHGIGMNRPRMAYLSFCLKRAGYSVLNLGYPSLRNDIENCAAFAQQKIENFVQPSHSKIHFVAHSMGCLVALELLASRKVSNPGRAVLIAPPYQGSEVADMMQHWAPYRFFFGPAGQQLTTAYRKSVAYDLPEGLELGVIAGTRAWEYPLFLSTMKQTGSHDGLVSLKSTLIPGAKDHITIRMSHSFLLEKSAGHALHFLEQGRFIDKAERPFTSTPTF